MKLNREGEIPQKSKGEGRLVETINAQNLDCADLPRGQKQQLTSQNKADYREEG